MWSIKKNSRPLLTMNEPNHDSHSSTVFLLTFSVFTTDVRFDSSLRSSAAALGVLWKHVL
jgi:hypothetical protein